jgi:type VI secretion system secreted protein Hcp
MTIDYFLKLDSINGESTHLNHGGEVELLSWSWGLIAPLTPSATSGKATPRELTFTHAYDKASPLLSKAAVQGRRIKTAVLSARKAGEGQEVFLKFTLKDVQVTSVAITASEDARPLEQVSLAFTDIQTSYKPQDDAGRQGTEVVMNWNIKTAAVS